MQTKIESLSLPEPQGPSDTNLIRQQMLAAMSQSEEYRHAVVEESIRMWITSQIKSLREGRTEPWDYKTFAEKLGKKVSWAYRLEDPNEVSPTIPTLLQVARTFDVALEVRFVAFSKVLDDLTTLHSGSFTVPTFNDDANHLEQEIRTMKDLIDKARRHLWGTIADANLARQLIDALASSTKYRKGWDMASIPFDAIPDDLLKSWWAMRSANRRTRAGRYATCDCGECPKCKNR